MIITRTPFRVSFFGGGTDFPEWYKYNSGSVISTTIRNYSFIIARKLPEIFPYNYRLRYYHREEVSNFQDLKHPVVREAIRMLNLQDIKLDITHHGDLPSRTGIGSSSAFTVGLLQSLSALQGKYLSKKQLADKALYLEHQILKEPSGCQDQIATSFGGFNKINFYKNDTYSVDKIPISKKKIDKLVSWTQLFYTGINRDSFKIEEQKIQLIKKNNKYYTKLNDITKEAEYALSKYYSKLPIKFGQLMNLQWMYKKKLFRKVSNSKIDNYYNIALKNGAIGGKLCGSGGGGFLLLITPPRLQSKIRDKIKLKEVKFELDNSGSQIIHASDQ